MIKKNTSVATFNIKSENYKSNRPEYPTQLYDFLSSLVSEKESVWDCACGNGQASKDLVNYFKQVHASDININQIKNNFKHSRIEYTEQDSVNTNYQTEIFDMVCVAQAIHWFASENYFNEVKRVLKKDGIFACWGYSFFKIEPEIDYLVNKYILEPIKPFWSNKNQLLWNNFKDIDFPFTMISVPEIEMYQDWDLNQLIDYIKTWSAYKSFNKATNSDIFTPFISQIVKIWSPNVKKRVNMDFTLYCGRNISNS